jgi:hypothetical protein
MQKVEYEAPIEGTAYFSGSTDCHRMRPLLLTVLTEIQWQSASCYEQHPDVVKNLNRTTKFAYKIPFSSLKIF